jgi:Mg2+ and Co2+ transporter CorA
VQRLQRERAVAQADAKFLEENYADSNLQLATIKAHIKTLLENANVARWLATFIMTAYSSSRSSRTSTNCRRTDFDGVL